MRFTNALGITMALLAAFCTGFAANAAEDMTPPAVLSAPGGMVYATVGEPVEFTICGESFVGGDIDIDPIDGPGWCDRVSGQGDCETYAATPDTPGVHTLWFRIVDDENDMETAYAVTVEAAPQRGDDCDDAPLCDIIPTGPIKIDLGESIEFEVGAVSLCESEFGVVDITDVNGPDWCQSLGAGGSDGRQFINYTCTPPSIGMHTLTFRATDSDNGLSCENSITIEVNAPGGCTEPPLCDIIPTGPAKITLGESIDIEFGAVSLCDGKFGVVDISQVNGPDWCLNTGAGGADGRQFTSYTCTPPTVGMHTLTFRATESENGLSCDRSITIEVNEPGTCMDPPSCNFDPPGPIKLTVGQTGTVYFDIFTGCDDHDVDLGMISGDADFCEFVDLEPLGTGAMRATFSCAPTSADVGMRTLTVSGRDTTNNMTTQCSLMIEVNEPCDDPPTCRFVPEGPIKLIAGQGLDVKLVVDLGCADSLDGVDLLGLPVDFISAVTECPPDSPNTGYTFTIATESTDAGTYTLNAAVYTNDQALTAQCSLEIEVNEPCAEAPRCINTQEGPLMAYVGEEFSFEICGDSLCEADIEFTPLNLPDWCSESDLRFIEHCVEVTCTPPNNVEGMYTFEFELLDTDSMMTTTCSVDVEVVCHLEPECYFTENGPIEVAVGEEIDFEFCGVAACLGHKARIEMTSRPPFIEPAGHQKGGADELLCLPIRGTPGPDDVGYWNVHITTKDLDTGIESECSIQIIVTGAACPAPICTVGPSESMSAVRGQQVMLTACGLPGCLDGSVRVEAITLPEFCDPFDPITGEPGDEVCVDISCTIPMDTPDGEYPVVIRVTDLDSGQFTDCGGAIIVGPPPACIEEEPNNELAQCTVLDAQTCLNIDCGAFIAGYLDDSGDDVDFYCIDGLQPNGFYDVLVINGVSCDLEPTCAMAVCVDDQGTRVGPGGSQGSECIADENGTLLIGVTGCGDYDLDGQADDDVEGIGGIGHGGRGSYQLLFSLRVPSATNDTACHADMNGDGMVDAADLGMMIGVFGEVCAPE